MEINDNEAIAQTDEQQMVEGDHDTEVQDTDVTCSRVTELSQDVYDGDGDEEPIATFNIAFGGRR